MERTWAILMVGVAALSGCRGIHCPTLQDPGTAKSQREWAQRYDPYPESQVGPEVAGARPRDFDATRAEPQRARHFFLTPYERSLRRSGS